MKNLTFLLAILLGLSAFNTSALAQVADDHDDSDGDDSGLVGGGGDDVDLDFDSDDDFDITDNSSSSADVDIDDDNFYLNINQIPGMSLNDIDQMIHTNIGTASCPVEEAGGTEFRIGFPPSIVIKDQDATAPDCIKALSSLSNYTQANVLVQIVNYVNNIPGLNSSQRTLLMNDLNGQVLRMFIPNYDDLMSKGRWEEINKLQQKLEVKVETEEDTYDKFTRILQQNRTNNQVNYELNYGVGEEVETETETEEVKIESEVKGAF